MSHIVPGKIVALAAGLRVPPYRVAVAVLADWGIDMPLDLRTPEAAIEQDPGLPDVARRALLAILREHRA